MVSAFLFAFHSKLLLHKKKWREKNSTWEICAHVIVLKIKFNFRYKDWYIFPVTMLTLTSMSAANIFANVIIDIVMCWIKKMKMKHKKCMVNWKKKKRAVNFPCKLHAWNLLIHLFQRLQNTNIWKSQIV